MYCILGCLAGVKGRQKIEAQGSDVTTLATDVVRADFPCLDNLRIHPVFTSGAETAPCLVLVNEVRHCVCFAFPRTGVPRVL